MRYSIFKVEFYKLWHIFCKFLSGWGRNFPKERFLYCWIFNIWILQLNPYLDSREGTPNANCVSAVETVLLKGIMGDVKPLVASFSKPVVVPANISYVAGMKFMVGYYINILNLLPQNWKTGFSVDLLSVTGFSIRKSVKYDRLRFIFDHQLFYKTGLGFVRVQWWCGFSN